MGVLDVRLLCFCEVRWQAQTGLSDWVWCRWAIGLFMYQSLDAIDGYVFMLSRGVCASEILTVLCSKQARRTGMAGPLGEMFDHGCDALNTTVRISCA